MSATNPNGSTNSTPELVRRLGLFDATMLVMGGIIGSGIFINAYVVARQLHTPLLILGVWAFGGLIALAAAFIWAELAALRPEVGGQYAYLREAYHPSVAFLYGWGLLLVIQTGGMAAVAVTFARYFLESTHIPLSDGLIAALVLGSLTLINCLGVRVGSTVQSSLMVLKIITILALIICGFLLAGPHPQTSNPPTPLSLNLLSAIGAAMVPVLFAYGGWQTATFVAGEIREPRRNLPRALVIGVVGVVFLYLLVNMVYVYVLNPDGLAQTTTPASDVMRFALGSTGANLIAAGIAISTLGFLSQGMLTAPRVYFAMAEDGLFFKSVARVHPKTHVPIVAIVLQGLLAMVIALWGRYEQILNYVVSVDFIFFGLTAICIFVLRKKDKAARSDGVRVPGHPVTTALFIAICWIVVINTVPLSREHRHRSGDPPCRDPRLLLLATEKQMTTSRAVAESEYMHWAKTRSQARFNLATSGLANLSVKELRGGLENLELTRDGGYGYEPLQQALAKRLKVDADTIVAAIGTSLANHLAMAAVVQPGDEVLIEQPTYEPLLALARYLGADVKRFGRTFEQGFRISPEEIEKNITSRTRLIVLTNMHNPSSVLADLPELQRVGDIAKSVNARVMVDEVYLEARFARREPTAFHLGPQFITTSSLTKAFGLSGLRCGWIVAKPDLAQRIWRMNDLFGVMAAHPAERLSVVALEQLERIGLRANALLEKNRKIVDRFLESRSDLEVVRPDYGTIVFPRMRQGTSEKLTEVLREKYETSVVPGRFFEMPAHFRLGFGIGSEALTAGLERLGAALDEIARGY